MGDLGVAVGIGQAAYVFAVIEAVGLDPPQDVAEGPAKPLVHLIFL